MQDYEKELLADFDSDSDVSLEEEPLVENSTENEAKSFENLNGLQENDFIQQQNGFNSGENSTNNHEKTFFTQLSELIASNTVAGSLSAILSEPDISSIEDITAFSKVYPFIPQLKKHIELYSNEETTDFLELLSSIDDSEDQSEEYKFILLVNELSGIINQEIIAYHQLLKTQYKVVFPELETLVLNPIDYARIIAIIKQDLKNIRSYDEQMKAIVSNEKILVIIMAALQQLGQQFVLNDKDMNSIIDCCVILLELDEILQLLSNFITQKLTKFAPNVSAIVGSITTSQLLIATGSLKSLAMTPSCNLASLGIRDLSSKTKSKSRTVRQTGYLYHSEVVKYLPEDIVRSTMRIVSGKVILAARVDLAGSCPDGSIGHTYLEEIRKKIDKLLTPPEHQPDKALPAPVDVKSKKRGGRRFRKMKERFQMSDLRRAQNKMEFGKEEDSVTDSFGEEIGLGMSRTNGGSGRIGEIRVNTNTGARMSKGMVHRLQKHEQSAKIQRIDKGIFDQDFDSILLVNPSSKKSSENKLNGSSSSTIGSKWFTGMSKRKNEDDGGNDKKRQQNSVL
ncbi:hypothetical protein G9P44_002596 [Scheffersomyces stipitis]|nr:hypothetical protein G9P44_002596 [Scheffersomyces stipitis]